jgi:sugar phosphate isomerase/epimerase
MEHTKTRRELLKLAAAGSLLCATSPLYAFSRLDIGIGTYSYHTISIDAMIVQLNLLRIGQIEMSRGEFMLLSHPQAELFRSTREKLDRAGIRCISYYSATIHNSQEVELAIRFAKILGCSNITGDAPKEVLPVIDRRLTQEGLTFGLHNHFFPNVTFPYESPEEVWNAIAGLSKTMGATVDTGQYASCGYDPVDAIRKLAPRIRMVHLKDVKERGSDQNVLLGRGIAHIPAVMRELRHLEFPGLVAIEYEANGNDDEAMKEQIEYARRLS